jgi:hypothetical protein
VENQGSPILQGMARSIAQNDSVDSEILQLERELGIRSSKGTLETDDAIQGREKAKSAKSEQIQKLIDTPAESPKEGEPSATPTPAIATMASAVGSMSVDFAKDAAMQVAGGVASTVQGFVNAGVAAADFIDNKFGDGKFIEEDDRFTFAKDLFPESKYPVNRLVRGVTQFLVPYGGITKTAGITGTVAKGVASMATDFLAFEGDEERVAALMQDVPQLANPFAAWLAGNSDDSEFEGRFKNMVEGLGLGVAAEGLFKVLRYIKSKKEVKKLLDPVEKIDGGGDGNISVPKSSPVPKVPADLANLKPSDISSIEVRPAVDPPLLQKIEVAAEELTKSVDEIGKGGGYQVNLTKIDADTDVLSVIKNFADADKVALEKRLGPKQTEKQLQLLSKELGVTVEELLSKRPGEAFSAEQIYAARVFHASAAENLTAAAKKAVTGSDADKYEFMQSVQAFKAINLTLTGAKSEAGRALRSLSYKVKGDNPEATEMIASYIQNFGDKNVIKMARLLSDMPPEGVAKAMRKNKFQNLYDSLVEVRINNLLANPTTHAKNNISNFTASWYQNLESSVAPMFRSGKAQVDPAVLKNAIAQQKILSKIDTTKLTYQQIATHKKDLIEANKIISEAVESSAEKAEFAFGQKEQVRAMAEEALAAYSGLVDGVRGLQKTVLSADPKEYQEFFSSPNTDYFSKMEGFQPAITSENWGGGPVTDIFGGIHRMPTKALDWEDNYWKAVNYRMEVHKLSANAGVKQGLSGEELQKFVLEFANDPPDSIKLMAQKRARTNTFTNPLDTQLSKNINDLIKTEMYGIQPLKAIIPFARTPINISNFIVDRSPLAWRSETWNRAMAKGGREAQMAKAQMALGTTVMSTLSLIGYLTGRITGNGPGNRQQNAEYQKLGKKRYSTLIGDTYVPNSAFGEPFASYLNMAGDISEISHALNTEVDVREAQEVGALVAWSLVNSMSPDQVMRGFSDVISAIQDRQMPKSMAADMTASMVPFSGFARDFRRSSDPVARDTSVAKDDDAPFLQEIINKLKNQVPGFSEDLPARKNMFGEDIILPDAIGPDVISPFYTTKVDKSDVVLPELFRLGYGGPFSKAAPAPGENHLSITMPPRELTFGGNKVILDPHQYAKYVELSGGHGLKQKITPDGTEFTLGYAKGGFTLKETLAEVIKDDYKHELSARVKTDKNKRLLIKKYILGYRKAAAAQLLKEYPELGQKLQKSIQNKTKASVNSPEPTEPSENDMGALP